MLDDVGLAVASARAAGLGAIVTIGIDIPTSRQAVRLAVTYDDVYATVGVHPHDAATWNASLGTALEELASQPRVVAIGECGLDYYRDLSPRDAQKAAFSAQIELARRVALPLVVHVREAGDEALAILDREASDLTVVMHCFSLPQSVDECNERGYYASFAGNVTYKNAGALRDAAARVREDRLLVETDAPFLAPVPFRGSANAPHMVSHTAALLAEVRGWTSERLAEVTTGNARRVFRLDVSD